MAEGKDSNKKSDLRAGLKTYDKPRLIKYKQLKQIKGSSV